MGISSLEPGRTYVQWNPASWVPVPGKDAVVLPKFLPGCLDHQLGDLIPFRHPGDTGPGLVQITGYTVAGDGSGIWIRLQVVKA